jgi:hypothetical protein
VHHPVCLITANGVLPRQPAASESLFPSDCSRPVCFCYLSPTMVRRRWVGGSSLHGRCRGKSSLTVATS